MSELILKQVKGVDVYSFSVGRKKKSGFPTAISAARAAIDVVEHMDIWASELFRGKTEAQKIRMIFGMEMFNLFFPEGLGK